MQTFRDGYITVFTTVLVLCYAEQISPTLTNILSEFNISSH